MGRVCVDNQLGSRTKAVQKEAEAYPGWSPLPILLQTLIPSLVPAERGDSGQVVEPFASSSSLDLSCFFGDCIPEWRLGAPGPPR